MKFRSLLFALFRFALLRFASQFAPSVHEAYVIALLRCHIQLLLRVHVILSGRTALIMLLMHVLKCQLEHCHFCGSIWFSYWKLGHPFVMTSTCVRDVPNKKTSGRLIKGFVLFSLQKKHLVGQNDEISSRNASLQTENESLRSELDLLNQDYEVLQEEMTEAKEHYKDLDMSATKIAHRCEVISYPFC